MNRKLAAALAALTFSIGALAKPPAPAETIALQGLARPVDILVDQWGVPHLYAANEDDVFFAQGFNAARDRLFQIDLWRRRGLGELSEVFGPAFVEQDKAARLFLYRGDMDPNGRATAATRSGSRAPSSPGSTPTSPAWSANPSGSPWSSARSATRRRSGARRRGAHPQPRPDAQPAQRGRARQLGVQGDSSPPTRSASG